MATALNLAEVLEHRCISKEQLGQKILELRQEKTSVDDPEFEKMKIGELLDGMLTGGLVSEGFEDEVEEALNGEPPKGTLGQNTPQPPLREALEDIRELRRAALNATMTAKGMDRSTVGKILFPTSTKEANTFAFRMKKLVDGETTITDPMCERLATALDVPVQQLKVREMTKEEQGRYNRFLMKQSGGKRKASPAKTRRAGRKARKIASHRTERPAPTSERLVGRTDQPLNPARLQDLIKSHGYTLTAGKKKGTVIVSYVLTTEEFLRLIQ